MNWQEVCDHPDLQNLPFKIELNERGQIILSPANTLHSLLQAEIAHLLRTIIKNGRAMTECAVSTRKGTKVADVAWVSPERLPEIKFSVECPVAPEICVEVISESNTDEEMAEKRRLYFENGAEEVWLCSEDGVITFFNSGGILETSGLAPGFPVRIVI